MKSVPNSAVSNDVKKDLGRFRGLKFHGIEDGNSQEKPLNIYSKKAIGGGHQNPIALVSKNPITAGVLVQPEPQGKKTSTFFSRKTEGGLLA